MESSAFAIGFFDVRAGLARIGWLLFLGSQVESDVETDSARTAHLLRLDGISIELCFVGQYAHSGIDVARIALADAALQLQVHFFAASRVFLAEHFGIDRRLLVHRLVIRLENRAFAEAVASRELDVIGKGRPSSRRARAGGRASEKVREGFPNPSASSNTNWGTERRVKPSQQILDYQIAARASNPEKRTGQRESISLTRTPTGKGGANPVSAPLLLQCRERVHLNP